MLKIIDWDPKRGAETICFLEHYSETALSLLLNYTEIGPHITDHPNSGNFKLLCRNNEIAAVFCLTKIGNVLIQTDKKQNYSEIVLQTCLEEERAITGIVGDWEITKPLWETVLLKFPTLKPKHIGKQFLYRLDLNNVLFFEIKENVRFLKAKDFDDWQQARKEHLKGLGISPEDVQLILSIDQIDKRP